MANGISYLHQPHYTQPYYYPNEESANATKTEKNEDEEKEDKKEKTEEAVAETTTHIYAPYGHVVDPLLHPYAAPVVAAPVVHEAHVPLPRSVVHEASVPIGYTHDTVVDVPTHHTSHHYYRTPQPDTHEYRLRKYDTEVP